MKDDQNGRRLKWKMTKLKDDYNGILPKLSTTKIRDNQNERYLGGISAKNIKEM